MKRAFDDAEIDIPFPQRTATIARAPARRAPPQDGRRETAPRRRVGSQGGYEGGQEP